MTSDRSLAARIRAKQHLDTARCPRCLTSHTADPSLQVHVNCRCGAQLMPVRLVTGIRFAEMRGVA